MKTRIEVEELKRQWEDDPCWDLEDTDEFSEYKEELLQFRLECEAKWEERYINEQLKIDSEAQKLGVEGIYRLIIDMQKKIDVLEAKVDK